MSSKSESTEFRACLGERLREVARHFKNRARAAGAANVSQSTYQRWVDGEVDPSFSALARLAKASGISLDWLATGEGDMYGRSPLAPEQDNKPDESRVYDEDLMAKIADGISSVYRDENARIAPGHLARASVRMFNTLVAAYENPIEREIGIKVLLQQLRMELRAPVFNASGKGSA